MALRATSPYPQTLQTKNKNKQENQKIPENELFSYQSKFLCLWFLVQKPFLITWPKKGATKKLSLIGVPENQLLKSQNHLTVTKRPLLDKQILETKNSSYHFWGLFLFEQQKTQQIAKTPLVIVFQLSQNRDLLKIELNTGGGI